MVTSPSRRESDSPAPVSHRFFARAGAFTAVLLLLTALGAACGGDGDAGGPPPTPAAPLDGELTVSAFEWGFEPQAIALAQGEEVRIVLQNDGSILHNFKVEEQLSANVISSESTGPLSADEDELFVGADGGQRGVLVFVPQGPGTFVFYCTIQNHRQLGMEGVLVVE